MEVSSEKSALSSEQIAQDIAKLAAALNIVGQVLSDLSRRVQELEKAKSPIIKL